MCETAESKRSHHEVVRSRDATGLIRGQCRIDRRQAHKRVCKHNRVLDRLTSPLTEIGCHWMRGVTKKDDATIAPAIDGWAVEDVGSDDPLARRSLDQLLDRRVPSGEFPTQIGTGIGIVSTASGSIGNGEPVHPIPPDWDDSKSASGPPAFHDAVGLGQLEVVEERAPAGVTSVAKGLVATHGASD